MCSLEKLAFHRNTNRLNKTWAREQKKNKANFEADQTNKKTSCQ